MVALIIKSHPQFISINLCGNVGLWIQISLRYFELIQPFTKRDDSTK